MPTTATGAYGTRPLTIVFEGVAEGGPAYAAWLEKLSVLERFNGRTFRPVPADPTAPIRVALLREQQQLLDRAYATLRESVYESLFLQTRGKPYLDAIGLTVDETGDVVLDFSGTEQVFSERIATDTPNGLLDLIDLARAANADLNDAGWNGWTFLGDQLRSIPITEAVQAVLDEFVISFLDAATVSHAGTPASEILLGNDLDNILNGSAGNDRLEGGRGNDTLNGGEGDDIVSGDVGADTLYGDAGDDLLDGGAGNDLLDGGYGNDTLDGGSGNDTLDGGRGSDTLVGGAGDDLLGGAFGGDDFYSNTWNGSTFVGNTYDGGPGNDTLRGGYYADTYRFGLGDGADTIREFGGPSYPDTLRFGAGIGAADIGVTRAGNDLVFAHQNATDRVTVQDFFLGDTYNLERVEFADGTVWGRDQLLTWGLTLTGTEAADTLTGVDAYADTLLGLGGDDALYGLNGNDTLDGGADHDRLGGGDGSDRLQGGSGNDQLYGKASKSDFRQLRHLAA